MINNPVSTLSNASGNQTQSPVGKPDWHHLVSKAMEEYQQSSVLSKSVTDHLKNAGEAVFTEKCLANTEPKAVASLVDLAAQGGPLGGEACRVLFQACDRVYTATGPTNSSTLQHVDRIQTVGAKALAAFNKVKNDATQVAKMPVDLLHVAWQHAKSTNDVVLPDLEAELNLRLGSAGALDTHSKDQAAALKEIHKVAGAEYGGTLVKGLGVVDLSGKPPTDAQREDWFKDLKEGQQRPVSFKLADDTFVHGFVHIDAKGKQHIVVVSNNPDKDFGARFAKALGLPEESCTMEKLSGLGAGKGMSEAGLAKWLFSYCAARNGSTKEKVEQFQKHVQSFGDQNIVDFTEAKRVRRLAAEAEQEMKQAMDAQVKAGLAKAQHEHALNAKGPVSGVISLNVGQAESDLSEIQLVNANESAIVESAIKEAVIDQKANTGMVLDGEAKEAGCFSCMS